MVVMRVYDSNTILIMKNHQVPEGIIGSHKLQFKHFD